MSFSAYPSISSPHNSISRSDDAMEISDEEEYDESSHPSLSEMRGQAVAIQRLNMGDYINEEVYIKLSQILDPQYTLRDISEKHCKDLASSMRQQGFYYSHGMMSVFFRADGNPPGATMASIFEEEDGRKVVKSGCFLLIMDGRHRRRAIEMLKEEGGFPWTEERFRVRHVMRRDGVSIQHAEAIKLSKVANTSTAIVRKDTSFVDTMKALVNYAGAFELEYGVTFVDARTKDIVDDTQSSNYLPTKSRGTYKRYIRFAKLVIKNRDLLELLETLSAERPSGKSLGISHVDSPVLYVSDPDDALLLVEAANFYVANPVRTATFHGPSFYTAARAILLELHELYRNRATELYPTFMSFMTVKMQGLTGTSRTVKHLFLTNMRLFDYDPRDKRKRWADSAAQRQKRLMSRVKKCFPVQDDQPKATSKPKGITEAQEGRSLRSRDKAISKDEKDFPGVGEEEEENEDVEDDEYEGGQSGHDDDAVEEVGEEEDYVPGRDGDSGQQSNRPKKRRKTRHDQQQKDTAKPSGRDSRGTGKSDVSASLEEINKGGKDDGSSRADDAARSELSTSQLRPFDDTVPLKPPDGYEDAPVVVEEVEERWIKLLRQPPWMCPESIFDRHQAVSAFLKCALIPDGHRAHLFLKKGDVLFLRNMVWMMSTVAALVETEYVQTTEGIWDEAIRHYDSALPLVFMELRRAELRNAGYTMLHGMADPLVSGKAAQAAAGRPEDYPGMKIRDLNRFVLSTFPGEKELKDERNRTLWNPIFNHAVEQLDRRDRDKGVGRYSSTKVLLVDHMERVEKAKYAKARAALDVWLGLLAAALHLEKSGTEVVQLPKTGGRYLLTGRGCPPQTGHNDFEHGKTKNPGYFMLVTGDEATTIWVCPGSHNYVDYSEKDKLALAKNLKMEEVVIDRRTVFVGHGHVQHAGAGWKGDHALRYHTYVIPEGVDLKDAVAFAYGDSLRRMPVGKKPKLIDLEGDGNEDQSEGVVERPETEKPVSEEGHTSEGGSKESPIGDWDLGTAGVEILED